MSAEKPIEKSASLLAEIERLKQDLTHARAKIAELDARADVDPLLDIFNRRGFERELKRSLAYVARYGTGSLWIEQVTTSIMSACSPSALVKASGLSFSEPRHKMMRWRGT
jgi:PleD family two-component response regulator